MTIDSIARVVHEANSAYCTSVGDPTLPPWDNLDETYRESKRAGVRSAIGGSGPRQLHESWMQERANQGWVHGAILDRFAKVHPNLVDYDLLPPSQKVKDALFLAIVYALQSEG